MNKTFMLLAFVLLAMSQFSGSETNAATQNDRIQEIVLPTQRLQYLIDTAKSQGPTWNEKQWQLAITDAFSVLAPILKSIDDAQDKLISNPEETDIITEQLNKAVEEFDALDPLFKEFNRIVDESPIASEMMTKDPQLLSKLMIDAGISESMLDFLDDSFSSDNDPIEIMELKSLIESAKTEGSNWTEQQWKEAVESLFAHLTPIMDKMSEIQKSDTEDPEELAKMAQIVFKYDGIDGLMEEFEVAARATAIGTSVMDDAMFLLGVMQKTGFIKYINEE